MWRLQNRLLCIALCGAVGCSYITERNVKNLGSRILSLIPGYTLFEAFEAGKNVSNSRAGLTEEEEYYLGRAVAARIMSIYPPLEDAELNSYLNKVAAVAVAFSDRPETFEGYHVQALDTNEVNSLSTPGGFLFVTRGLLQILQDEDTLAAVLAHEIGHVQTRHGMKAIDEKNISQVLSLAGKTASALNCSELGQQLALAFRGSVDDVFNFLEKGYSRDQEFEADAQAIDILGPSGYDASALITALEQLSLAGANQSKRWLSSHPATADRIARVQEAQKGTAFIPSSRAPRVERFQKVMGQIGHAAKTH